MHATTTRRRFRLQRQTFSMLAAILDFSARHHLCQFMPAVSETTDNREHFNIRGGGGGGGGGEGWRVRVTPRKSGQFHSLSPYHNLYHSLG